jgi:hypothetical protein
MRTRPEPSLVLIRYWCPVFVYRAGKRCIGHTTETLQSLKPKDRGRRQGRG